jgi:thiamine-phosphate pyrophosphorylase
MTPGLDLRLYLVTDRGLAGPRGVIDTVAAAVAGGVTLVQVRSPGATGRSFVEEARALKALLTPLGVALLVNDRVDVALAVDADGVHVGQSDIDAVTVRAMLGPRKIIGLSVGSPAEWQAAQHHLAAVDYIGAGPVFATTTKTDAGAAIGCDGLASVVTLSPLPVVAIGGIGAGNAAAVMSAGPQGIAVVSAVMAAVDPARAARDLRTIVDQALETTS